MFQSCEAWGRLSMWQRNLGLGLGCGGQGICVGVAGATSRDWQERGMMLPNVVGSVAAYPNDIRIQITYTTCHVHTPPLNPLQRQHPKPTRAVSSPTPTTSPNPEPRTPNPEPTMPASTRSHKNTRITHTKDTSTHAHRAFCPRRRLVCYSNRCHRCGAAAADGILSRLRPWPTPLARTPSTAAPPHRRQRP